jgi:Putative auto-transporter adhesin, head GIN domain
LKIITYIAILLTLAGCNPDGIGCFKSTGTLETITVEVPDFSIIDVTSNIDIHLTNGAIKSVQLTAGGNIIPGIRVEVVDGTLFLENLNTCNWTRKYINPVVVISNPELNRIVQRGHGKTTSTETLTYDQLVFESKGGSGDFEIDADIRILTVVSNEVANYYVSGNVDKLNITFAYCDAIFFGENLLVNNCRVNHVGSNTMHLNVTGNLTGRISSFGDVIVHAQMPQFVDVEEAGKGTLIYKP